MAIAGWIAVGLLVGVVGHLSLGRSPGGIVRTLILGVAGALCGGLVGHLVLQTSLAAFFDVQTWALAFVASAIGVVAGRAVSANS